MDDKKTFIAQIDHLSFPDPDAAQDSQPRIAADKHVYVDINPEESVANTFNPGNPGQPAFRNVTFHSDAGRILAKFRLRDVDTDFAPLALDRRTKHSTYAIWWVETKGNPDWHAWKSHYYRVNTDSSTVIEMDSTMGTAFVFVHESYEGGKTPRLADWNKHQDVFPSVGFSPVVFTPVVFAVAPSGVINGWRNSSWVSCGVGCCNGQ